MRGSSQAFGIVFQQLFLLLTPQVSWVFDFVGLTSNLFFMMVEFFEWSQHNPQNDFFKQKLQ